MVDVVPPGRFADGLALDDGAMVAFVGGGGKTTLLHALARQLTGRVVATTTTRMSSDQDAGFEVLVDPGDDQLREAAAKGPVMVWRGLDGTKALGAEPEDCDRWFNLVDYVLVEADGSRRRPFKAPADFEPVVPTSTTHLVSVVGIDALGRVIVDQCHRPLRVAALAGCRPGQRLTPARAARVLLHPNGMLRAKPVHADFTIVITKVDQQTEAEADELRSEIRRRDPDTAVVVTGRAPDQAAEDDDGA